MSGVTKGCALVVAPLNDVHAFAVQKAAAEVGKDVVILDPADQGNSFRVTTWASRLSTRAVIEFGNGRGIDLQTVTGLWWRRPFEKSQQMVHPHPGISKIIERERKQALFGSLATFIPNAFNEPGLSRSASLKVRQLEIASRLGLLIPDTLISDNSAKVREWCSAHPQTVFKMFHGVDFNIYETRLFKPEHLEELWRVDQCPAIFQAYVEGEFDVRATLVGEKIFAAKLDYPKDSTIIDTRLTQREAGPIQIPSHIADKLRLVARELSLRYAAFDLRVSKSGEWTFFEVNPEGQYLWTEIEASLPISAALVEELSG